MFELFKGGLGIVYHYDLRIAILFLTNLNCSSVTSCYAKNMTYTSDLLGVGSTSTNIPGYACSVDMDNADNDELAKKYGVRTATINLWKDADTQWAIWHEYYSEQLIDCSDGFESMCELVCICCVCGMFLFLCDVKWVDSRKNPLLKEPPSLRTYPTA